MPYQQQQQQRTAAAALTVDGSSRGLGCSQLTHQVCNCWHVMSLFGVWALSRKHPLAWQWVEELEVL